MALTCEIKKMNVDEIFVLYENSEKYFKSYIDAFHNSQKPMQEKQIYYVFTPTMQKSKRVSEFERIARNYFNKTVDCDFYDIFRKKGSKQLNLIGEL